MTVDKSSDVPEADSKQPQTTATTEYCAKLQQWMWQYYWGYANWQSWLSLSAFPFPLPCTSTQTPGEPASTTGSGQQLFDVRNWYSYPYPLSTPASSASPLGGEQRSTATDARPAQQQNGNPAQAGREYTIPSPLQRFLAETVDFFILFCVKATIVLWIMHLSGMKDIAKFITHFIVEEIDENTSIEDLQKMMAVALVYRVLVCVYENIPSVLSHFQKKLLPNVWLLFNEGSHGEPVLYNTILFPIEDGDATLHSYLPETICIWGAGGATPGKFLLGLRVVTCDTSTLVRPNRVLVVPASHVSLSASTVRALNKNFSIAFLFPVFITLLFFQHNRTVYDIVAGTIVVQRRGAR